MMTRPVRDRILKDANGDISDHLRNHIHLTNCIHLKNHMHKHSPMLADRSLMRDLMVLQRSRSLKDPSASPPSVVDVLPKEGEVDAMAQERRRSLSNEHRREGRKLSATVGTAKAAPKDNEVVAAASDRSSKSGVRGGQRVRRSNRAQILSDNDEESSQDQDHKDLSNDVSWRSQSVDRKSRQKGKHVQDVQIRTPSEQLKDIPGDSDDVASSHIHLQGRYRVRRRKHRGARKARAELGSRDIGGHNEISVASNSFAQGEEEYLEQSVARAPRNGCGNPWKWSSIHDRGKTFLDIAGKSFSCGLADSRSRKGNPRNIPDMPVASSNSSSMTRYDGEATPLLIEPSGSQGSTENAGWVHDYSGELGIFADHLLKHDVDSNLASEARSGGRHNPHDRHQNLTQKYMPSTFKDLVGQNLVAQALSNAVMKRKVGLVYVFYGPHGTGKTSCARIFARALNCQSLEHPKPCGICSPCIAHDKRKSRNIREIGPVSNFDLEGMLNLLDNMIVSRVTSHYRVLIIDDCDTLPTECWSAITKVIDRAPRHVVFVLVSSSLDVLPHIIISRCQKFFFPKLKDGDIIHTLQWIATKEDLEIDKDALKLIASRSDGSLRDAEMTLEQLSLLGQKISVPLVQELVGLICDEKLVDLLDLALSADTVNTVKNLRVVMETGVEPLALMSQLATVITDILAGGYDFTRERHRRKFFRRQPLSKEDMEKLRQALRTLSEAEKQLRISNDKSTWLTAALLQLASDHQYMLPTSAETSLNHSPLNKPYNGKDVSANARDESHRSSVDRQRQFGAKDIWMEVLGQIQINSIKEFLYHEGKLISVSFGAAPTVQLMFSSLQAKSKAEKFRGHILQAFESVLGSPVTVEIRCGSKKDTIVGENMPSAKVIVDSDVNVLRSQALHMPTESLGKGNNEIVEIADSSREPNKGSGGRCLGTAWVGQVAASQKNSAMDSTTEKMKFGEKKQSLSIVKGKVSLAHVIQKAEGRTHQSGWSGSKAISIAAKLEHENLRLEPRSRSLLCWKAPRVTRRKVSRLKVRARRPDALLKIVSCGKCLSSKSWM